MRWLAPLMLIAAAAAADAPKLTNPTFSEWRDGLPVGWQASVGAGGGQPLSRIGPLKGGGLLLSGDAGTRCWRVLGQPFDATAPAYRLRFTARAEGLKQERGQYSSRYVGLAFFDRSGKRLALQVADVLRPAWEAQELIVSRPAGAIRGAVWVMLSMTGRLSVRSVALTASGPGDSFPYMVRQMDRHYSYFAHKKIDWQALVARHRAQALAAQDAGAFVAAVRPMLAALRDQHVWIQPPGGRLIAPYRARFTPNHDIRAVARQLTGLKQIGKIALVGRTREGYGYLLIGGLRGQQAWFDQLQREIAGMQQLPGILIDLRANGGGSEMIGQRIAAWFTDRRRLYARSRLRSGPKHTDLAEQPARHVAPRRGGTYRGKAVCLIGPGCVSSGEGMAAMFKAMPHVRLLGQPTRGASGNPRALRLPNGVTVYYSTWVSLLPDGTVLEDRGVLPDQRVAHEGPGDPTFAAGVAELKRLIQK